jgi:UDP-glucose 4-epimerase
VTFNLAAYGVNPGDQDPALAHSVNAEFPEWLAHTLGPGKTAWYGNRLVHVGTQYEYGRVREFHEDAATTPVTLYGESKLAGTQGVLAACSETGLRAVTPRIFNVFGPGEGGHRLLPTLMRAAIDGTPIDLTSGEQKRDFCVVHDIAEGLLRLGAAEPLGGDPVNLASGRTERVRDFIEEAAHQLQIDLSLLRFGARPDRPQEVLDPEVSVDRLRHVTGWLPETSVAEGIRRTVAFVPQVP